VRTPGHFVTKKHMEKLSQESQYSSPGEVVSSASESKPVAAAPIPEPEPEPEPVRVLYDIATLREEVFGLPSDVKKPSRSHEGEAPPMN
jgi:hypothetical protein